VLGVAACVSVALSIPCAPVWASPSVGPRDAYASSGPWGRAALSAMALAPAARPQDSARAEALLAQADAARTEERWAEAARLFTEAYDALPAELLVELGEATVRFAVESHRRVAETTDDDAPRRAARDLVTRFEGELAALAEPRPLPEGLAQMRGELEAELEAEPAPSPGTWQAPPPTPPPRAPDAGSVPASTTSWVLVGVGSAAIVAGLATLVWGSRILPIAQRRLDARGPDLDDPLRDEAYLDENRRRGRLTMGFGGAIAVIGVPLLVWGVVRLTAARRRSPAASLFGPGRAQWADPSGRGWVAR
jgi:hypothetical protein